jgi:predicted dehydrogenase
VAGGRLRVGVIGLGFGARVQVPGFHLLAETEVVAVCSTRRERAAAVAAEYGIPAVYTDYRALLADPRVEAVSVATPPHLHHAMSITALLAGKHVLCEKPLARTVAEARDMVRQAEAAGVVHMVDYELRFQPARQYFKALVDSGYLGELRSVSVTIFRSSLADPQGRPYGWLMERDLGGGMLGAVGAHVVDALLWWFGPIAGVSGRLATAVRERRDPVTGRNRPVTADDTCVCLLQFAGGALGSIHISGAAWHGSGEHLEAYGSDGTLALTGDGALLGGRRGDRTWSELPVPAPDDLTAPAGAPPLLLPFMRLARQFARAARAGVPQSPTFHDGLRVEEVLGGVRKAARDGQWVSLLQPRRSGPGGGTGAPPTPARADARRPPAPSPRAPSTA